MYIYIYGWIYIMGIQRKYNGWPKILELKTSHSFSWGGSPLIGKGSVDFDCTTGKNSKSQVPTTFLKLQHVQSWFVRISSANEDPTQINTTKIRALSILFIYILLSLYSLCSVLYLYIIILYMFVIFVCNSCLCIPYIYLYPYFCSCAKCGISWHISCISRGNQQTDFKKQKNIHIPTQSTLFLRFFQLISPSPTPIFSSKIRRPFLQKTSRWTTTSKLADPQISTFRPWPWWPSGASRRVEIDVDIEPQKCHGFWPSEKPWDNGKTIGKPLGKMGKP